jgi:hypothetical protein
MKVYLPLGVLKTTSLKVYFLEFEDLSTVIEPTKKKKTNIINSHQTNEKFYKGIQQCFSTDGPRTGVSL